MVVDASWDKGLASILPINAWTTPFTGMSVAVPAYKTLTPEESEDVMNACTPQSAAEDLRKNGGFFKALNEYFERVRTGINLNG